MKTDGRRAGRIATAVAAGLSAALLAGCAGPPADASWVPPAWPAGSTAVTMLVGDDAGSGSKPAAPESGAEEADAQSVAAVSPASDTAGLVDGRIRNDAVALQARYVEMPGAPQFTELVRGVLDAAIDGAVGRSGAAGFVPEVFDGQAGLGDRGCVAGSAQRPAAELLADPTVGPVGGAGTAVVCELTAAFGPMLGVMFRTVTGAATEVTGDESELFFVNVETREAVDAGALWAPEAAAGLWELAVEGVRRDAGALSAAPLAAPSEEQLELARGALGAVRPASGGGSGAGDGGADGGDGGADGGADDGADDGAGDGGGDGGGADNAGSAGSAGFEFTLPAGLAADELAALGVTATTAPLTLTVNELPDGWLTPDGQELFAQRDAPFVGVPAWSGDHNVDCDLVACVAVTYDDGPSAFTAELLDTLQAQESPATFFMMGNVVAGSADVVARAAGEGHELASHSTTHPDLTSISPSAARSEVVGAGKAITEITGQPVTMYRPPYGAVNDSVLEAVGLPAILWSIDTLDWQGPGETELVNRTVDVAVPGDIILFHDTHADSVNAADDVLAGLKDRGFTPVTVTQLFGGSVPQGRVSAR
ncbi:polysaccharide deacetylase family protein [Leucobacter sp. HY1908]